MSTISVNEIRYNKMEQDNNTMRQALEIIASGEEKHSQQLADDVLVELGYWKEQSDS